MQFSAEYMDSSEAQCTFLRYRPESADRRIHDFNKYWRIKDGRVTKKLRAYLRPSVASFSLGKAVYFIHKDAWFNNFQAIKPGFYWPFKVAFRMRPRSFCEEILCQSAYWICRANPTTVKSMARLIWNIRSIPVKTGTGLLIINSKFSSRAPVSSAIVDTTGMLMMRNGTWSTRLMKAARLWSAKRRKNEPQRPNHRR